MFVLTSFLVKIPDWIEAKDKATQNDLFSQTKSNANGWVNFLAYNWGYKILKWKCFNNKFSNQNLFFTFVSALHWGHKMTSLLRIFGSFEMQWQQKVCMQLRSFGSMNCSKHTEHSNSFPTNSREVAIIGCLVYADWSGIKRGINVW